MGRTSVARLRLVPTCLAVVLVAVTLAGCSSSTGSQGGAASCVGILRIDGHRYYPWTSRHAVPLTGRTIPATELGCRDTVPGSRSPDYARRMHEIRGIDPELAVAGELVLHSSEGRRIVYLRDRVRGHGGPLPSPLEALVAAR